MRLLDKRRDLREHEGEVFEMVQMLLKEVSSLLKEAREKVNKQRTAELEEEMSESWRNRQFALAARVESGVREKRMATKKKRYCFFATHSLGIARTGSEKWRNLVLKVEWEARSWIGKRYYDNYVRQCKEMANEEVPDDMECSSGSGTGQSSDSEVRKKSTRKKSLPSLGEFLQKHSFSPLTDNATSRHLTPPLTNI